MIENLSVIGLGKLGSGSTGQPKGVMVSHRNVVHFVEAVSAKYRFPAPTASRRCSTRRSICRCSTCSWLQQLVPVSAAHPRRAS